MLMFGGLFCCDRAVGAQGPPGTVSALAGLFPQCVLLLTLIFRMVRAPPPEQPLAEISSAQAWRDCA